MTVVMRFKEILYPLSARTNITGPSLVTRRYILALPQNHPKKSDLVLDLSSTVHLISHNHLLNTSQASEKGSSIVHSQATSNRASHKSRLTFFLLDSPPFPKPSTPSPQLTNHAITMSSSTARLPLPHSISHDDPQSASSSRLPLPPGHFLSLPPSYADATDSHPSGGPTTSSHESNGLAPNVASLASADFEVDVRTGFLPGTANVDRLTGAWSIWEDALDAARGESVGDGLQMGGKREKDKLWRKAIQEVSVELQVSDHGGIHSGPVSGSL
jgi:hypothetical protein